MEIVKKGIEMSEAECPQCGTVLRYWPSELKTEVLPGYVGFYSTRARNFCIITSSARCVGAESSSEDMNMRQAKAKTSKAFGER